MKNNFGIPAILLSLILLSAAPVLDLKGVIAKDYGKLKGQTEGSGCMELQDPMRMPEELGMTAKCTMIYKGEVDKKTYDWPVAGANIFTYPNQDVAKNRLGLRLIAPSEKDVRKKFQEQAGVMTLAEKNDRTGLIENIYWVSNSSMVIIHADDVEIPQALLDDYKQKYPPTVTFTVNDLKAKTIIKANVDFKFELIDGLESSRAGSAKAPDKPAAFVAMLNQCMMESDIRCLAGLANDQGLVDCANTLITDDAQRRDGWRQLADATKPREVLLEKVNWSRPGNGACKFANPDVRLQIAKTLGLTMQDMQNIPPQYLK